MKKITFVLVAGLISGCTTAPKGGEVPTSQPSRIVFQTHGEELWAGYMKVDRSDLREFVKEFGPYQPVVVRSTYFPSAVRAKKDLQEAGFRNVAIDPAGGG